MQTVNCQARGTCHYLRWQKSLSDVSRLFRRPGLALQAIVPQLPRKLFSFTDKPIHSLLGHCLLQAANSFSGKGEVRAGGAAQEPYTGLCHSVAQFHYLQNRDNGTKIVISIIMISLQAQHQLINSAKFDTCSSQSHITLYNNQIPFTAKETVSKDDAIRLPKKITNFQEWGQHWYNGYSVLSRSKNELAGLCSLGKWNCDFNQQLPLIEVQRFVFDLRLQHYRYLLHRENKWILTLQRIAIRVSISRTWFLPVLHVCIPIWIPQSRSVIQLDQTMGK